MAIIYRATLKPSKSELLTQWVPTQQWWPGGEVTQVATFRFDDPEGLVGIETFLLGSTEGVVQVPFTYRPAPAPYPSASLIGTMEHSVLGTRWVYDALTDPTYLDVVREVIRSGGQEADLDEHLDDGSVTALPKTATVVGRPGTEGPELVVVERRPTTPHSATSDAPVLTGTWEGLPAPVVLARLI